MLVLGGLLLRWNGLLLLELRRVSALAGDFVAQRGWQLLAVVSEELRTVQICQDAASNRIVAELLKERRFKKNQIVS